ncbi:MAG: HDIG domain-containing protein [candidate division NC10 bacterium]|nr:HDIG domain-containing protein [candidate division NC10 bacterium]
MDLRFFTKEVRRDVADRLQAPLRVGWHPLAPIRRAVARLEQQRWFLPAVAAFFLLATLQILSSNLALPLGALSVLGVFLLVAFLLGALYAYVRALQPKEVRRPRSLVLLGTILLVVLLLTRYGLVIITSLHQSFPHIPISALRAGLPVPLGGVLLTVLFNARLAFAGSLILTILAGIMLAAPIEYFLFTFVGSLVGIFSLARRQGRTAFFRAGSLLGLANAYTVLAFALVDGDASRLLPDMVGGLVNGAVVAVLATGLLPLLEKSFGRTTDFTLLELSNLNEPMLRHLVLVAPGTYHHSIMVGTLAEAAAEAVGANALLCRVGAYYHDIGKTRHPAYFIENQSDAMNRHDKLAPSLSRAILMAHVKEGVEMARAYGLPEVLVDLIPQHHGTRLVSYFYQRARERTDPDLHAVKEEDYRYPGPKPQTREAAILMLADAVEAAARTLSDPTSARIQGAVQKIITGIFVDGQLDECDLTLRDLHLIANNFVRILTGIFHHRVDYPGVQLQNLGRKRSENGDQPAKPAKEGPRRDGVAKKGGGTGAVRAGAPGRGV